MKAMFLMIAAIGGVASYQAYAGRYHCEYWIGDDYASHQYLETESDEISIPLKFDTSLDGFHTIRYRVSDQYGVWSGVNSIIVYVRPNDPSSDDMALDYWLDNSYDSHETIPMKSDSLSMSVNTSGIEEGFHTLAYRLNVGGNVCAPHRSLFYKKSADENIVEWYKIWWNDQFDKADISYLGQDYAESPDLVVSDVIKIPDYAVKDSDTMATVNILFGNSMGYVSEIVSCGVSYARHLAEVQYLFDSGNDFSVHQDNGIISVSGLKSGIGRLTVFRLDGTGIFSVVPDEESLVVPALESGVYIMTYCDKSVRLIVH